VCIYSQHELSVEQLPLLVIYTETCWHKTRLVRNVTRVKRPSSITSSFIFSRSVISKIYFQWNMISKLQFCDQCWGLHWYVSFNVYTQTSDATGNIGSNLCFRHYVYGLDVPDMSFQPGAWYDGWFTPARYTCKNYHSNAKYMIKCNIDVHMVVNKPTSDKYCGKVQVRI
jgi:hypothetical protein